MSSDHADEEIPYRRAQRERLLAKAASRKFSGTCIRPGIPETAPEASLLDIWTSVRESRNASASRLQRTLGVAYRHAERGLVALEAVGLISKPDALGRRTVLAVVDAQPPPIADM